MVELNLYDVPATDGLHSTVDLLLKRRSHLDLFRKENGKYLLEEVEKKIEERKGDRFRVDAGCIDDIISNLETLVESGRIPDTRKGIVLDGIDSLRQSEAVIGGRDFSSRLEKIEKQIQ